MPLHQPRIRSWHLHPCNPYNGNKTDVWALGVALALPFDSLMLEVPPADADAERERKSWAMYIVCMVGREWARPVSVCERGVWAEGRRGFAVYGSLRFLSS